MKIEKIYFDMDGVLADFDRGVKELLNLKPLSQENSPAGAAEVLFFAIKHYPNFFEKLQPIEDSVDLLNTLRKKYDIEILTGIPKPERGVADAKENKAAWIKKYLDEDIIVNAVLRKDKKLFAKNKSHILIDDFSANIEQWEKAGGTGILFKSAKQALEEIERIEKE